jgi:hypothetical protein
MTLPACLSPLLLECRITSGAHTAVVTSHEGLAAAIAPPLLVQNLAEAANPLLTPAQRAAAVAMASAASCRSGSGRAYQLLLQARQQLAVCMCCWQRCGWWPDCVGAVLGSYPSASPALAQIAAEAISARARVRGLLLLRGLMCCWCCLSMCNGVHAAAMPCTSKVCRLSVHSSRCHKKLMSIVCGGPLD